MEKIVYAAFILGLILTACKPKPKACITANKTTASVNEVITFNSCSEHTHHVDWDFGDGTTDQFHDEVKHTYVQAGTYQVTLNAHSYEDRKKTGHKTMEVIIY